MALNIPNVGFSGDALMKGLDTGSTLFSRYMQPVIQREQLAEQGRYHQGSLAQQQAEMQQRQQQFLQELALRKQAEARQAMLAPLQQELYKAQAQAAQANAAKARMWADILSGGNGNIPSANEPITNKNVPSENESFIPSIQGTNNQTIQQTIPEQKPNVPEYGQEVILNQGNPRLYGLDSIAGMQGVAPAQTHYDTEGNLITRYPSGRVTMTHVGKTGAERKFEETLGSVAGKQYENAVNTTSALEEQQSNLERLASDLEKYPHPEQVIGPINKHITDIFGTPEQQKFLGEIASSTGNIVLDAAKGIKGAFTGRDQSLINSLKPNATDRYWTFLGKLKAMGELNQLAQRRASIYADLISQKIPPHAALKIAQEKTKVEPITQKYESLLRTAEQKNALYEGKIPTFKNKQEATTFLNNLSPQDKIKLLNMMGQ